MPLVMAPKDTEMKIRKVFLDGDTKRHLENLGILPGGTVTILQVDSGSVIIKVKEGRIALDQTLARKILVA